MVKDVITYDFVKPELLKSLLVSRQEEVFGVENYINHNQNNLYLFTDPMSKIDLLPKRPIIIDYTRSDIDCYYLNFSKDNYMPFLLQYKNSIWSDISKIKIPIDTSVFIQIMLKLKRFDDWKDTNYEQYQCYLEGIKYPSRSRTIRRLQYKILNTFPKWAERPLPIDESLMKLEQNGYMALARLLVQGEVNTRIKLAERILRSFNLSRHANSWELSFVSKKRKFIEDMQTRRFINNNQILCLSELQMFAGDLGFKISLKDIKKAVAEESKGLKDISNNVSNTLKDIVLDDSVIIEELTQAFISAKLIDGNEKLDILSIKSGVTLIIVELMKPQKPTFSNIKNKETDLEIALDVDGLSVQKGFSKGSIVVTYPRKDRQIVKLQDLLKSEDFIKFAEKSELPVIVGVDMFGKILFYDFVKLTHMLIAGATNGGKSTFLVQLLLTLMYCVSPDKLKLHMIDTKKVELSPFKHMPHLASPVIFDPEKAIELLDEMAQLMEERYDELEKNGLRNILEYNTKFPESQWEYNMVVVEEFADLKMLSDEQSKRLDKCVVRLNQKGRASGIHVVIATQRPQATVVSPMIKDNTPTKITFSLSENGYKTVFGGDITLPFRLLNMGDGAMYWNGNSVEFLRFQSPIDLPDKNKIELGEELDLYQAIIDKWNNYPSDNCETIQNNQSDSEDMIRLKRLIAETGETKMNELREQLQIDKNKLPKLMHQLVDECWLESPTSKKNGYKLLLSQEAREDYLNS
jgi:S-DNA-T family DNA segregation ATPase FtsK/SpoIIIE